MKHVSFVTGLLFAGSVAAQIPGPNLLQGPNKATIQTILDQQAVSAFVQKTTDVRQRLVSRVGKDSAYNQLDSTIYWYSTPARGSYHNPAVISSYFGNGSPSVAYLDNRRNEPLSISCDSMLTRAKGSLNYSSMRYRYDASNRLVRLLAYQRNYPFKQDTLSQYILHYNAAGERIMTEEFQDTSYLSTPSPKPYSLQFHAYNALGKAVFDSVHYLPAAGYRADRKYSYSYDAAGRLSQTQQEFRYGSAPTVGQFRYLYFYNNDGLLSHSTTDLYDPTTGTWLPNWMDSFSYAGNSPSYTYYFSAGYNNLLGVYEPFSEIWGHVNAAGNWDTLTTAYHNKNKNIFVPSDRYVFYYNSYGNYRQLDSYSADTAGVFKPLPDRITQFNYEDYTPPTGVPPTSENTASYRVYPNPSTHGFRVERVDAFKNEAYILADVQGRILLRGTFPAGASRLFIPTEQQAPGVYFLTLMPDNTLPQTLRLVIQ